MYPSCKFSCFIDVHLRVEGLMAALRLKMKPQKSTFINRASNPMVHFFCQLVQLGKRYAVEHFFCFGCDGFCHFRDILWSFMKQNSRCCSK